MKKKINLKQLNYGNENSWNLRIVLKKN